MRYPPDPRVARWAKAAYEEMQTISENETVRAQNLRHGGTWFVGVDVLPNDFAGKVRGVPLKGPWTLPELPLHRAQVSIVYPGYPKKDVDQSSANHAYRVTRKAAHVDGLLPVGPKRRRFPSEWHAFILGIPLDDTPQAPTVVWRGSHKIVERELRAAIGQNVPSKVDVTEAYHKARRAAFDTCEMVALDNQGVGSSFLLHRFVLHGTELWSEGPGKARMTAFFRPQFAEPRHWLDSD